MKWWFGRLLYHLVGASMKLFTTVVVLYVIYSKTTPEIPLNLIIGFTGLYWAMYPMIYDIFAKDEKGELKMKGSAKK